MAFACLNNHCIKMVCCVFWERAAGILLGSGCVTPLYYWHYMQQKTDNQNEARQQ